MAQPFDGLKNLIKKNKLIYRIICNCLYVMESIVFGGEFRERILVKLLGWLYQSRFRRDWIYKTIPPHFFSQRETGFQFIFGKFGNPYLFSRGFFNAEIMKSQYR